MRKNKFDVSNKILFMFNMLNITGGMHGIIQTN